MISDSNALLLMLAIALAASAPARGQQRDPFEEPPISYSATAPRDAIAALEARLAAGTLKLAGDDKAVVRALLDALNIPVASQVLVFSKTSLQRGRIAPDHPRALYFSDTCFVGWVPGGLVEVASLDPALGPVFYAFDPRAPARADKRFVRDPDCLSCHGGLFVREIPGVMARSVFADAKGEPLLRHGTQVVDHRTPFSERWGGWYVTGQHGDALHRGNVFAAEADGRLVADFRRGANVTNLSGFFPVAEYLAPTSDIVALLVLEHQLAVHNTLTHAAFKCRRMLHYQQNLQKDLQEPVTAEPAFDSVKSVFSNAVQEVVDVLLFHGEARLPDGIAGSADFQNAFVAAAPRAADGSHLKELWLKEGRLFKHRCSYLIYTPGFLELPELLKRRIYARLGQVLEGREPVPRYAYLGARECARIAAILRATHPDLRGGFPAQP